MRSFLVALFALSLSAAAPINSTSDPWDAVRTAADAWSALEFDVKFGINVGDASGTLFTWTSPDFSMDDTRMEGASLSKWPAAIMISGLVADGTLSYDDLASKHLEWWTKDPKDPRSGVTLRHLLSFTSGFTEDKDVKCASSATGFAECAQELYEAYKPHELYKPDKTWTYLGCHLQFAGAMAVAASGKPIDTLFEEYLYKPFNMTSTTWTPIKNPQVATGITTTGSDFENLLSRLLTYKVLPRKILDQMETDWSQAPVSPSGDGWFGHYGMGHWWECLGYGTPMKFERSALPKVCMANRIQAGPGMFGYYPLLDRSKGGGDAGPQRQPFYFQIALQESYATSGIPEYLRIALKPVVDVILSGGDPATASREELLYQGAGLLPRDFEDIQSALKTCRCEKAGFRKGEPFKSLTAGMPQDNAGELRRTISNQGTGLLLRDLVKIQAELGTCKCTGRR